MNNTKALQLYPEQQEIDTLKHRIRDLLPGAAKFTDAVLTAFAQISLAHDLDPFIGECWIIPTKRGPRIRAGIEGHRKAAHKQSNYQLRQRQMTGPERDAHGLHDKQVAAVTEIYRADSVIPGQAYIPTCGYGIWSPANPDAGTKADRIPHTKTHLWVAFKRSEQDALRKAFDLPFLNEQNGTGQALPAHVGPDPDAGRSPTDPTSLPEPAGSARAAAANLYGDYDQQVLAAGEDDPPAAEPTSRIVNTETGEITELLPADNPDGPPLDQWGSFRTPEAAITWGLRQGAFTALDHARNAYIKLKADAHPKNAQHMAQLWIANVAYRLEQAGA